MRVAARCEDQERAPDRGVQLVRGDRDVTACDPGADDELDVGPVCAQTVCSSAIASASSRMAMPSSSSSRVIVSGGQIMITFQWVMR